MATLLLKHTWTTTVSDTTGVKALADTQVILGSTEFEQSIGVGAGATEEMDCGALPYLKMKSLFFSSDQDVTIETNAANHSGGQEIILAAKVAFAWNVTMPTTNPITADITKIFVTNAGSKAATFNVRVLMDQIV